MIDGIKDAPGDSHLVAEQLPFDLSPADPFAMRYFVAHSGVADALTIVTKALENIAAHPREFSIFVIIGPEGSGKTHLAYALRDLAGTLGLPMDHIEVVELERDGLLVAGEDERTAKFIARYEELRSAGGAMLVTSREHPEFLKISPHVRSRLLAGDIVTLGFPQESELPSIIEMLFRKQNIRISPQSIQFLISRIPAVPLSFASISAKIERLSSLLGRPVRFGLVREAVGREGLNPASGPLAIPPSDELSIASISNDAKDERAEG